MENRIHSGIKYYYKFKNTEEKDKLAKFRTHTKNIWYDYSNYYNQQYIYIEKFSFEGEFVCRFIGHNSLRVAGSRFRIFTIEEFMALYLENF